MITCHHFSFTSTLIQHMRQYTPIWDALKKHGIAKLLAPACRHKTISQAVQKEKWRDDAYRLGLSEKGKKMKLDISLDEYKGEITFKLVDASGITTAIL